MRRLLKEIVSGGEVKGDPSTLEAVVISHLHPDHHVDLVALLT